MHESVITFVETVAKREHLDTAKVRILDIGGRHTPTRYYQGLQPRDLFANATKYHVLDVTPGPDVDIVADATKTLHIAGSYDVVLCLGTLEHIEEWPKVLETVYQALVKGGILILTCAGPGFRPHPATTDDFDPPPGEWYRNVFHLDVREVLIALGFRDILTQQIGNDTQAVATK